MVDETDKALISLGILVGAAIISGIIAKIVDICYDRASISDDASDVSEHTRNLIRARLTVMKFRNKKVERNDKTPIETEAEKKENAVKVFRIWSAKSRVRAHPQGESAQQDEENMKVEDIAEISNDNDNKKDVVTKVPLPDTDTVVTVDETVKPEAKRPKSALKKPKPAGSSSTDTSGNTSIAGADGARPKSGVKRVTIAEPEGTRSESLQTISERSREGKSASPASTSGVSLQSSSGSTANNPPGIKVIPTTELRDSNEPDVSHGEQSEDETGVVEAWNAEEGATTSSADHNVRITSPATLPHRGKADWSKTYVLYRGNSNDLYVPFKSKGKSKAKTKPRKAGKGGKEGRKKEKNAKK